MSAFLNKSELTERRAFIKTFLWEVVVMPDNALMRYTVPMPDDSLKPGKDAEKVALNGLILSAVQDGGAYGIRTRDLRLERAMSLAARRMRHARDGRGLTVAQYTTRVRRSVPPAFVLDA